MPDAHPRLSEQVALQLHARYCRGWTLAQVANSPDARGIGLGRSEQMRVLRLSREFHARGWHVRSSSENATRRHKLNVYRKRAIS